MGSAFARALSGEHAGPVAEDAKPRKPPAAAATLPMCAGSARCIFPSTDGRGAGSVAAPPTLGSVPPLRLEGWAGSSAGRQHRCTRASTKRGLPRAQKQRPQSCVATTRCGHVWPQHAVVLRARRHTRGPLPSPSKEPPQNVPPQSQRDSLCDWEQQSHPRPRLEKRSTAWHWLSLPKVHTL